jgi:hypothetical protein
LYVGGNFDYVGPYTGGGALVTDQGDLAAPSFIDGWVENVAPDGNGGWYLAGIFSTVEGVPRQNLAHLLSDGTVDPSWAPNPNGGVGALAVSGSTVYVGGSFTSIGGQARSYLAALDSSGRATTWNPGPDKQVGILTVSGSTVYAGGGFTSIGGQPRHGLAAIDTLGSVMSWNPNPDGWPSAIAVAGSIVYVGGSFTSIGGQPRSRIAALDSSGNATSWNPGANDRVLSIAVAGDTVYAGGYFSSIGGQPRHYLAAIDSSGSATNWNPNPDWEVLKVAVSGSTVYVGGDFAWIGGEEREFAAAIDSTGHPTSWHPNPNSGVEALGVAGNNVYVGGAFTFVGGDMRENLAELDLTTGKATSWDPMASDTVKTLAVSGSTVYAGGDFRFVGQQNRNYIAGIDSSGAATSWNPNANDTVNALLVSGSTVYAGGEFTIIGSRQRYRLAALDPTGVATAFSSAALTGSVAFPSPPVAVNALAMSDSTIYAGGNFTSPRKYLAAFSTAGALSAWNPNPSGPITALATSGTTLYAGGNFGTIGGQPRSYLAAINPAGTATSWNPSPDSDITALAVSGGTVYAGGYFTHVGGQDRSNLAALDSLGNATAWNPAPDDNVDALAAYGSTVYAGGSFGWFNSSSPAGVAAFIATPVVLGPPLVTGTAANGQILAASKGSWDNDPASIHYQWLRDGTPIPGATAATYTLTADDTAHLVGARVTATNLSGSADAVSAAVHVDGAPVNDAAPTLSGTPRDGETLTADPGTWRASPAASLTYQWRRCDSGGSGCTDIADATTQTYSLAGADVASTLRVAVTGCNSSGCGSGASAPTTTVTPMPCQQNDSCASATDVCQTTGGSDTAGGGSPTPTLRREGDTLVADGTTADTTISTNPANGVLIQTDDNSVCITPTETSADASAAQVKDGGTKAQFSETAPATDTQVVPTGDGVETFDVIHSDTAAEDYSWKVHLQPGQQLLPTGDGSVAIVDTSVPDNAPEPGPVTPADPADIPQLKQQGAIDADAEAPNPAAVAEATTAVASSGLVSIPPPSSTGDTTAAQEAAPTPASTDPTLPTETPEGHDANVLPADAPPPGMEPPTDPTALPASLTNEISDGAAATEVDTKQIAQHELDQAQADVASQNATLDAEQAAASTQVPNSTTVGVIQAPAATDAQGNDVPTILTTDGDTVTMHVDHQQGDYTYPISADPMVKVADYHWVQHTDYSKPVYRWEPRAHQEWRFAYIGSWFGSYVIQHYWHYFWGYGNDGRELYLVWFPDPTNKWVLVHNEPWSGVFLPYQITVQDPPVKIFVGYQTYWTYDPTGTFHYEFHFDPNIDCSYSAFGDGGDGYPADCVPNPPDGDDTDDPADIIDTSGYAVRGMTIPIKGHRTIHTINGNWTTIRTGPRNLAIGSGANNDPLTVVAENLGKDWRLGTLQHPYAPRCGWIKVSNTSPHNTGGTGSAMCSSAYHIDVKAQVYSSIDCDCTNPTTAALKPNVSVTECANIGPLPFTSTPDRCPPGQTIRTFATGTNSTLDWRYVTKDKRWVMINDRWHTSRNAEGSWAFVPRNVFSRLPKSR